MIIRTIDHVVIHCISIITSDIWLELMATSVFEAQKDFIKSKYILTLEGEREEEEHKEDVG